MSDPRIARPNVQVTPERPNSVYRYYDHAGRLIYVGITAQGPGRQRQHNATSEWWQYVASQQVEHCPDRETALRVERALIEAHRPPFNRTHNGDWEPIRVAYLGIVRAEQVYEAARLGQAPPTATGCGPCDWTGHPDEEPCQYATRMAAESTFTSAGCNQQHCDPCHAHFHGFQEALPVGYEEGLRAAPERLPDLAKALAVHGELDDERHWEIRVAAQDAMSAGCRYLEKLRVYARPETVAGLTRHFVAAADGPY